MKSVLPTFRKISRRSWSIGFLSAIGLMGFYLLLISILSSSFTHAVDLFKEDKLYVILISVGFGLQITLFKHFKEVKAKHGGMVAAAGTGTSTATMIACCLHHVGDVAPVIGLSGAAVFMSQYKAYFMTFGILMNVLGIYLMLRIIIKHSALDCCNN
ncbi:MAG: hypothetical protein SCK28_09360 [Bacillota bacterium]|nr:hypothetical protein [Bacillota bacterium]